MSSLQGPPIGQGVGEEGVFSFEVELGADIGTVVVDGADADEELICNLLARLCLGDQF